MSVFLNRVSCLATGTEIIHGDIQDTNSHYFAQQLHRAGCLLGPHLQVGDNIADIVAALAYLLTQSRAIIITGGLGPTSDDCTRFALSAALNIALTQDLHALTHLHTRMTQFAHSSLPVSNLQQTLFLPGHTLIPNPNGSACGSYMHIENHHIWMLPGPPRENRPMFETQVYPALATLGFLNAEVTHHWFTMGLSEGEIAEKIDAIFVNTAFETGYRWSYPLLEVKVRGHPDLDIAPYLPKIEIILAHNLVSKDGTPPIEHLKNILSSANLSPSNIAIWDGISQGRFTEIFPENFTYLQEPNTSNPIWAHFAVTPLIPNNQHSGRLTYTFKAKHTTYPLQVHTLHTANIGPEVVEFAIAYMAWQLSNLLLVGSLP